MTAHELADRFLDIMAECDDPKVAVLALATVALTTAHRTDKPAAFALAMADALRRGAEASDEEIEAASVAYLRDGAGGEA